MILMLLAKATGVHIPFFAPKLRHRKAQIQQIERPSPISKLCQKSFIVGAELEVDAYLCACDLSSLRMANAEPRCPPVRANVLANSSIEPA